MVFLGKADVCGNNFPDLEPHQAVPAEPEGCAMRHNRFSMETPLPFPQPPTPAWTPTTFILCPLPWSQNLAPAQWAVQQWVYQCAFEQAQAVVKPSILERDLLGVWN
jgi:hypothetical protein